MNFNDTTVTDQAMQAVSAANIELPAEVRAAVDVCRAIRAAQNEQLPDRPALPAIVGDVGAAVNQHAAALIAHAETTSAVNARRQAAAALQPVVEAQLAGAVTAAVPEMTAAVVEAFNAEWAACPAVSGAGNQFQRLNALYEARRALGACCGERQDPIAQAVAVFEVSDPGPAGRLSDGPSVDRLYRWSTFTASPHERWHLALPPYPVHMVGPDGVPPRLTALHAWTNAAPQRQRVPARMGAPYDWPLSETLPAPAQS